MFVELHMIQNFAPSCLNRDDTNAPKDCEFGGYRRARISSQCLKRAIRNYWSNDSNLEYKELVGKRTADLVNWLTERYCKENKTIDPNIVHAISLSLVKAIYQ